MKITRKVYKDRIEWTNESGELHRLDGPAYEFETYSAWYLNGKRHREDGPAIEYKSGYKAWYLNGEEISEQEFNDYILKKRLKRIMEL